MNMIMSLTHKRQKCLILCGIISTFLGIMSLGNVQSLKKPFQAIQDNLFRVNAKGELNNIMLWKQQERSKIRSKDIQNLLGKGGFNIGRIPAPEEAINKNNGSVDCTELRFADFLHPLPLTALATYPGSGNTWTRHLIQQLTGYHTGSVYNDLTLKRYGFPGEFRMNGSVVVIKTHLTGNDHRAARKFERAIIVIRNPFDALIAEFNRRRKGHVGVVNGSLLQGQAWESYVALESRKWMEFHQDWLSFKAPKLVLFYEELKSDLVSCLRQMCDFLNLKNICTEERIGCVVNNSQGNFHRKSKKEVDPYSLKKKAKISEYVKFVYNLLEKCVRVGSCTRHFSVWPIGLFKV